MKIEVIHSFAKKPRDVSLRTITKNRPYLGVGNKLLTETRTTQIAPRRGNLPAIWRAYVDRCGVTVQEAFGQTEEEAIDGLIAQDLDVLATDEGWAYIDSHNEEVINDN